MNKLKEGLKWAKRGDWENSGTHRNTDSSWFTPLFPPSADMISSPTVARFQCSMLSYENILPSFVDLHCQNLNVAFPYSNFQHTVSAQYGRDQGTADGFPQSMSQWFFLSFFHTFLPLFSLFSFFIFPSFSFLLSLPFQPLICSRIASNLIGDSGWPWTSDPTNC